MSPLQTVQGGHSVRMRITSNLWGGYVIKISHNAEIPLTITKGPLGFGQGVVTLPPGKTYVYEFGALEHRPEVLEQMEKFNFQFSDGRDVDVYQDMNCLIKFGLGLCGRGRQPKIV
jgi:hypothetical protein